MLLFSPPEVFIQPTDILPWLIGPHPGVLHVGQRRRNLVGGHCVIHLAAHLGDEPLDLRWLGLPDTPPMIVTRSLYRAWNSSGAECLSAPAWHEVAENVQGRVRRARFEAGRRGPLDPLAAGQGRRRVTDQERERLFFGPPRRPAIRSPRSGSGQLDGEAHKVDSPFTKANPGKGYAPFFTEGTPAGVARRGRPLMRKCTRTVFWYTLAWSRSQPPGDRRHRKLANRGQGWKSR